MDSQVADLGGTEFARRERGQRPAVEVNLHALRFGNIYTPITVHRERARQLQFLLAECLQYPSAFVQPQHAVARGVEHVKGIGPGGNRRDLRHGFARLHRQRHRNQCIQCRAHGHQPRAGRIIDPGDTARVVEREVERAGQERRVLQTRQLHAIARQARQAAPEWI